MTKAIVKVSAILDGVRSLKDRGLKVTFETQELSPEAAASLMGLCNSLGWLVFAPEEEKEITIPDEPPQAFKNEKTQGQRLRAVLFVWWKQLGGEGDFEPFYRAKMEQFIEHIKNKLDDGEGDK